MIRSLFQLVNVFSNQTIEHVSLSYACWAKKWSKKNLGWLSDSCKNHACLWWNKHLSSKCAFFWMPNVLAGLQGLGNLSSNNKYWIKYTIVCTFGFTVSGGKNQRFFLLKCSIKGSNEVSESEYENNNLQVERSSIDTPRFPAICQYVFCAGCPFGMNTDNVLKKDMN